MLLSVLSSVLAAFFASRAWGARQADPSGAPSTAHSSEEAWAPRSSYLVHGAWAAARQWLQGRRTAAGLRGGDDQDAHCVWMAQRDASPPRHALAQHHSSHLATPPGSVLPSASATPPLSLPSTPASHAQPSGILWRKQRPDVEAFLLHVLQEHVDACGGLDAARARVQQGGLVVLACGPEALLGDVQRAFGQHVLPALVGACELKLLRGT